MNRPIALCVTSPYEEPVARDVGARFWKAFLAGGTNHSARCATLPYIIRRCEREGVAFTLKAVPGHGYYISPGVTP